MRDLHAQSLEEASRVKEDLQNLIAEKERELKVAQDKLEMKEMELQEHKVEAERVGKRLEKTFMQIFGLRGGGWICFWRKLSPAINRRLTILTRLILTYIQHSSERKK